MIFYFKECFFSIFSKALLSLSRTQEIQVLISEFTLVTKIIHMYRRALSIYEATARARQAQEEHLHSLNRLLHLETMETQEQRAGDRVNFDALTV